MTKKRYNRRINDLYSYDQQVFQLFSLIFLKGTQEDLRRFHRIIGADSYAERTLDDYISWILGGAHLTIHKYIYSIRLEYFLFSL